MPGTFPETVRQAATNRWCVRPWCTTCANHDFRDAIESIDDGSGEPLTSELSAIDLAKYITIPDWDDAVRVAFLHLRWPGQRERVLNAWLAQPDAPVRFLDVALYHIVRHYGDCDLRRRWIATCVERALATRSGSLTESLIWTVRTGISAESRLLDLASQLADTYPPVRKPLKMFYGAF
jgi:hypothetical protein